MGYVSVPAASVHNPGGYVGVGAGLPSGGYSPVPGYVLAQITSANLKLYYDARAGITGTSPVTAVADQSGNGNNGTIAVGGSLTNVLTLDPTGINGLPALRFGNPTACAIAPASQPLAAGQARTIVAILRSNNTNGGTVINFRADTQCYFAGLFGGANSEVAYDGTNLPMMVGQTIDTGPHVMSWTWTPSAIAVRYDGNQKTITPATTLNADSGAGATVIGSRNLGFQQYNGWIGAVLIFDGVLSGGDLSIGEGYLRRAWKL